MGMVRASFGIYNSKKDVDALMEALIKIINDKKYFESKYIINNNGDYEHQKFKFSSKDFFSLTGVIDKDITTK